MIEGEKTTGPEPFIRAESLRGYLFGALILWGALVTASAWVNVHDARESSYQFAAAEARAAYQKDVAYRRWATMHGGVYVPVSDTTPPNPYLHVPNRDVTTTSGLHLTLMNPAYMTRQVFQTASRDYGPRGHITALNPTNPENKPDPWEEAALRGFARGETETQEISLQSGAKFMRLMRPFYMENACRKCHDEQVGSVRGGISVSVPMERYDHLFKAHAKRTGWFHLAILLVGVMGILLTERAIMRQVEAWVRAGAEVQRSESEIRRVAEALATSEARHRIVSENTSDMIVEFDLEGRILFANDRHRDILGFEPEEMLGQKGIRYVHPEDQEIPILLSREAIGAPGRPARHTMRLVRRDGAIIWIDSTAVYAAPPGGSPRIFVASRNISEQRRAQDALLAAGRLAAVGSLAAGVAHEFNNLLTIQKNNALLLLLNRDRYGLNEAVIRTLNHIVTGVDRGADIVRALGGIALPREPERSDFDIVALLEHLLRVQSRFLANDRIQVEKNFSDSSIGVFADRGQVEQILINLIQNAVHAMIPMRGGRLGVIVRREPPEVHIEITDTGAGMDEATRARIFDPFFTTKGSHSQDMLGIPGTGLGLTISQKLVIENGGRIDVKSASGKGTSVILHFPVSRGDATSASSDARLQAINSPESSLNLMVVEDDAAQRESLAPLLAHLGFASASSFSRGPEALEVARAHPPDIAIIDYVMPEMNGLEVMRALRRISRKTRFVVVSGSVDLAFPPGEEPDAHLQKPINFTDLAQCLGKLCREIAKKK